jgi:ribosomal protein S1
MVSGGDVWNQVKIGYPVGTFVDVEVIRRVVFGVFVELQGFPEVSAIIDIGSYRPGGVVFTPDELPPPGARIRARIVEFNESTKQVKLRVGP